MLKVKKYSSCFEAKAGGCAHDAVWVRVGICTEGCRHLKRGLRVYLNWSGDGGSLEPFGLEDWWSHRVNHEAILKSIRHEKWETGGYSLIIMKALNFLWLWLLLRLCLTHGFEARSFHNRRYQILRTISRSSATIHQRQMRSLTHTARCRRYILYWQARVQVPSPSPKSNRKGIGEFKLWAVSKIFWATTTTPPTTFKHEWGL